MLLGALPDVAHAQKSATCPIQAPRTFVIAKRFASSPSSAPSRAALGLPTLDSSQVRLLTTQAGDGTTCGKLTTLVQTEEGGALNRPAYRVSYFAAGAYYYVVGVRTSTVDSLPPGQMATGWQILWVVNTSGKARVIAKIAV